MMKVIVTQTLTMNLLVSFEALHSSSSSNNGKRAEKVQLTGERKAAVESDL